MIPEMKDMSYEERVELCKLPSPAYERWREMSSMCTSTFTIYTK